MNGWYSPVLPCDKCVLFNYCRRKGTGCLGEKEEYFSELIEFLACDNQGLGMLGRVYYATPQNRSSSQP